MTSEKSYYKTGAVSFWLFLDKNNGKYKKFRGNILVMSFVGNENNLTHLLFYIFF